MRNLLELTRREEFREFIGTASKMSMLHGIVVDYDPVWRRLWSMRANFGEQAVEGLTRHSWPVLYGYSDLNLFCSDADGYDPEPDPKWRPAVWRDFRGLFGQRVEQPLSDEPYVVKICVPPKTASKELPLPQNLPWPILIERRERAVLAMPTKVRRPVLGGVSIGTGTQAAGTLGGIVTDQNGQEWGVTCAHVLSAGTPVDQPAHADSKRGVRIGLARHTSQLAPMTSSRCNPYSGTGPANTADVALIEMDSSVASVKQVLGCGPVTARASRGAFSPGDAVDISGKESKTRRLSVGGLAATYKLQDLNGALYCFHNLFELRWPRTVSTLLRRPVQSGDSGSWVLLPGPQGYEWAGMVLAGDRFLGYAQFADDVTDWAHSQHALQLSVT